MEAIEATVLDHYQPDDAPPLIDRIDAGLRAAGIDPESPAPEDLVPLENMHTGGIHATIRMLEAMRLSPGVAVLDLGAGIGGVSRAVARLRGAQVTGIDLTPEFVSVATILSRRTGMGPQTRFTLGSATDLPFADCTFDAAVMMHVGMNIADKARLFAEVSRVLRPGGQFGLCDIMLGGDLGPVHYPTPWATTRDTSFLETSQVYRDAAFDAGLELDDEVCVTPPVSRAVPDPRDPALPVLSPHLTMGAEVAQKITNHQRNLRENRITPVQMIFTKAEASALPVSDTGALYGQSVL